MHSHVSLNGRLLAHADARLRAVTGATLYGRGVFTTLAIHHAAPFLWQEHLTRLAAHAAAINLDNSSLISEDVRAQLDELIARNQVTEGRARISLLARSPGGAWHVARVVDDTRADEDPSEYVDAGKDADASDVSPIDVLIVTGDLRPAPEEGLALTVSPYRLNSLSPLAGLKTTNYLDHILPWEEARAREFDESLMLNERDEIVSATLANIFWVIDGVIHTPALRLGTVPTGALAGTTRSLAVECAAELAVPVVEGAYQLHDIAEADEIFLTSSNLGVASCSAFDFRRYTVSAGSVAVRLREALRQRTLRAT